MKSLNDRRRLAANRRRRSAANRRLWLALAALLVVTAAAACSEDNGLPTMEYVGERSVRVGETLEIVIRGEDPDGDAITFYIEGRPEGATFTQLGNTATLLWTPEVIDADAAGRVHEMTITVQDARGAWVSQIVVVRVFHGDGAPRFLNPAGYVLNLAQAEAFSFRVEVKDDDSAQVALTMADAPDGALFEVVDGKTADFYWAPSAEQVAEGSYFSVAFVADDGTSDVVRHEVALIVTNPAAARECPGQPPTLLHSALGDSRAEDGYRVTLRAVDAESAIRYPTLYWALGLAPTLDSYVPLAMTPVEGEDDIYEATIPAVGPSPGEGFVSYWFTASDDDDLTADRCDHEARLPRAGAYVFVAYHHSLSDAACLSDDLEPNDGPDSASVMGAGSLRGLRLCPGDEDWYRLAIGPRVRSNITLHHTADHGELRFFVADTAGGKLGEVSRFGDRTLVSVAPSESERELLVSVEATGDTRLTYGLDIELSESPCEDDVREPDDSATRATYVEPDADVYRDGSICAGNPDWFVVAVEAGQNLGVLLEMSPFGGDLDLVILAPDGENELLKTERVGPFVEELSLNVDEMGAYYVVVYSGQGADDGFYDLEVRVRDQSVTCQDDLMAPNHGADEAVLLPEGTWDDLSLCPQRPDWYAVALNGGEILTVSALAGGDGRDDDGDEFESTVWAPDGTALAGPVLSEDAWVEHVVAADEAGIYGIELRGPAGAVSALDYTLEFTAQEPAGGCRVDRLGLHDEPAVAIEAEPGFTPRLTLCDGVSDWFRVVVPEGVVGVLLLAENTVGGDSALELLVYEGQGPDSLGDPFAEADETERGVGLEITTGGWTGEWLVEVRGQSGAIYDFGLLLY